MRTKFNNNYIIIIIIIILIIMITITIMIITIIMIIIIIDMTIPEDGRVGETEDEKVEKYQDLARAFRKLVWDVRKKVNSVVIWGIRNSTSEFEKQPGPGCSKHG